jgi:hypothetical protein
MIVNSDIMVHYNLMSKTCFLATWFRELELCSSVSPYGPVLKAATQELVRRRRNYHGSGLGQVACTSPACTLATERRKWGTWVRV